MELEFSHSNANIMALTWMASSLAHQGDAVSPSVGHCIVFEPMELSLIPEIVMFHAILTGLYIGDSF